MKVSRIRKFKKSNEITIVLTKNEAMALSFKLCYERNELIKAGNLIEFDKGGKLGKELYFGGLNKLW